MVWECVCLEEVCGSCTMIIDGRVRQSCSAMIDTLAPDGQTIKLQPMSKFPVVRDLVVDRSRMFEDLKRVKAWISLDGSHALGPGPRQSQANQETAYPAVAVHDVRLLPRGVPAGQLGAATSSALRPSTRCASSTCTPAARCTRPSDSTP